jgi:foldase protein PrsA
VIRAALTLLAVVSAGAFLGACGGVPGGTVVSVDGEPIDQLEFDHWYVVAAKSRGGFVPDPENGYAKCVAARRKALRPRDRKKVTAGELTRECKNDYAQLRDQVLQLLISFRWIQGEANALAITATDAEVQTSFDEQKRQSFPKEADYQKFLARSGQTTDDILRRVRLDLLSNKIRDRVVAAAEPVTNQDLRDFYAHHKRRFAEPERRSLRVVLTKRLADADRARAALAAGQSWRAVAKRYSIDQSSKRSGGRLPAQAEGTLVRKLDQAVFGAAKGALVGPVKTQFGYYVFTVTRIKPAGRQSFAEAKKTIKLTLESEAEQNALDAFVRDFTARWRAKTICTEGFKISDCANGPAPESTPTIGPRMR